MSSIHSGGSYFPSSVCPNLPRGPGILLGHKQESLQKARTAIRQVASVRRRKASHFFLGLMRNRLKIRRNEMAKTMKNSVLAMAVMALAAMVGLAMTPLASAQQTQNPQQQSQAQGQNQPVTATGCLQKASSGQGYQLTDSSTMKTYDLTAASSSVDLSSQVGHTVTVTGTPTEASASNSTTNPANPATNPAQNQQSQDQQGGQQAQQLQVTNIQSVSNSCQGGGIL
ncbi:MAG: hypothetical protein ACRD0Y_05960 [Terriglobales bacterium]